MFKNLFSPDNGLMITLGQVTDCIFLSIFWMLGCIPIVTVGTCFAALYDASYRGVRKAQRHSWQRFLSVYRSNFKSGIVPGLLVTVLFILLLRGMILLWNAAVAGSISWGLFSAGAVVGALCLGILSVVLPMLSRFENSFGALMKNSVFLALANLPRTLGLGVLNAACIFLTVKFVVPVVFVPALAAFLGSFLLEPMFRPFMPQEAIVEAED